MTERTYEEILQADAWTSAQRAMEILLGHPQDPIIWDATKLHEVAQCFYELEGAACEAATLLWAENLQHRETFVRLKAALDAIRAMRPQYRHNNTLSESCKNPDSV